MKRRKKKADGKGGKNRERDREMKEEERKCAEKKGRQNQKVRKGY